MRTISAAGNAAILSGNVGMILLLELLTTPPVRLNSTNASFDYGGDTYLAGGTLGTIEPIEDRVGDTQGLRLQLSALPPDVMALALSDDVKGKRCTLSTAIVDKSSMTVTDVIQLFVGEVDQMPITLDKDAAVISLTVSHRGETFARPKPLRNTDADQQRLSPGDTSRRFVIAQSQTQDVWPAASFFRR